jgi:hypothetical protein
MHGGDEQFDEIRTARPIPGCRVGMNRIPTGRRLIGPGFCALLALTSGCHHTARSWAAVGRERASASRVIGVAPPVRGGGPERLAVMYEDPGGQDKPFCVTVPLADGGRPAAPFGYAGQHRDVTSIAVELPPEQVRAIQSARLRRFAGGPNGRLQPVTFRRVGTPVVRSGVYAMVYSRDGTPMPTPPTYTPDRVEMDARVAAFRAALLQLTSGEHLVLLPKGQPRPPGHARAAAARAVLTTPVTLGMDALELVFAPLWLLTG